MKNILILANDKMAKHFVQWVGKSRIDTNQYFITCSQNHLDSSSSIIIEKFTFLDMDPTSYMRLKDTLDGRNFATIFVVMSGKEESLYTLKNIRMIDAKVLVIFVSQWDDLVLDDEYLIFLNVKYIYLTQSMH